MNQPVVFWLHQYAGGEYRVYRTDEAADDGGDYVAYMILQVDESLKFIGIELVNRCSYGTHHMRESDERMMRRATRDRIRQEFPGFQTTVLRRSFLVSPGL